MSTNVTYFFPTIPPDPNDLAPYIQPLDQNFLAAATQYSFNSGLSYALKKIGDMEKNRGQTTVL